MRVYDHGFSGTLGEPAWTLVIVTDKKVPRLKFFTKWQTTNVNLDFATSVLDHLRTVASGEILAELVGMDRSGNSRESRPFPGSPELLD